MKPLRSIVDILELLKISPSNPKALNEFNEFEWRAYSSEDVLEKIEETALGLITIGIKPGDCVGILAPSSASWTIADLAIMAIGAISVPLFSNISEEHFLFEVNLTDLKYIFVNSTDADDQFSKHYTLFDTIIFFDEIPNVPSNGIFFSTLLQYGKKLLHNEPYLFLKMIQAIKPETLATIVFTSGSTGLPKGTEITQLGLVSLIHEETFNWKLNCAMNSSN